MKCIRCKEETDIVSDKYVEPICIDCDTILSESGDKCEKFRKQYNIDHALCPKCGGESHTSTLAGYIMHSDKLEEYKNLNDCRCSQCGDKHTTHDRVPEK